MTLRSDEPVKTGILRLEDTLIDAALGCARHPSRDTVEHVHFFRTTTKRLRALLQLLRPVIGKTAFTRESSRDRSVADETLRALAKSAVCHLPSGTPRHSEVDAAQHIETSPCDDLQRAMNQAACDLEEAKIGLHRLRIQGEDWDVIGPGLLRVYKQGRRRMREAFGHPRAQDFHRWRICVKHLFYQLEWLEPVWPKRFAAMLKCLHKLEEKLGSDHDLTVLRKMLKKGTEEFDSRDDLQRLRKSAVRKGKRLRRSSKPLGAEIFGEKPGDFGRKCRRRWKAWKVGI